MRCGSKRATRRGTILFRSRAMRKFQITLCAAAVLLAACHGNQTGSLTPDPPPILFAMRTYEKSRPGCGDHGNHAQACVSFRAIWPEFSGGANGAAKKMNAAVLLALGFPEGATEMEPFGESMIGHWQAEHRGVVYADSTWFERRIVQVLARRPGVWSFRVDRIGQTGKALPFMERSYLNLDPLTGLPVTLNAVLTYAGAAGLAATAERQLHAQLGLAESASLPLKANIFALPEQFALTSAGLVLAWQGDALSDPAAAVIEITVPWSEARGMVKASIVKPPTAEVAQGF